ncbi:MAG: hypothetical protein CMJ70_21395 [Planctomycetaceae bacterium]|nr:hypothetical protein [Planctomycetaceae bacterium]
MAHSLAGVVFPEVADGGKGGRRGIRPSGSLVVLAACAKASVRGCAVGCRCFQYMLRQGDWFSHVVAGPAIIGEGCRYPGGLRVDG